MSHAGLTHVQSPVHLGWSASPRVTSSIWPALCERLLFVNETFALLRTVKMSMLQSLQKITFIALLINCSYPANSAISLWNEKAGFTANQLSSTLFCPSHISTKLEGTAMDQEDLSEPLYLLSLHVKPWKIFFFFFFPRIFCCSCAFLWERC